MTTNQDAQATQTLEQTLNKTDLGHVINENKKMIMLASLIVVLAIIVYSVLSQRTKQKNLANLDKVFEMEQKIFTPYLNGKMSAKDFLAQLSSLSSEFKGEANLIPSLIIAMNKLDEENAIDEKTIGLLKSWQSSLSKENPLVLFMGVRLAALYEDQKEFKKAIDVLEGLVGHKVDLLKDRVHFDLGRLYLKIKDKKTAQERFEYIKTNQKDSEYNQLIPIYLNGIL